MPVRLIPNTQGYNQVVDDYLFIPISWSIDGAAAPDPKETVGSTNKVDVRKFAGTVDNQDVFIPITISPDAYGQYIKFRVRCIITESTPPSNESIRFVLSAEALDSGDNLDVALSNSVASSKLILSGSQYDLVNTDWSEPLVIAEFAPDKMLMLNLARTQDHSGDTYEQKIGVIGVDLVYKRLLR